MATDATVVRVWRTCDKQTRASKRFAFVEFPSSELASGWLEACSTDPALSALFEGKPMISFARDLYALNSILQQHSNLLTHWNPLFSLDPFPEVAPDEIPAALSSKAFLFEPVKASAASSVASQPAPKKMKINFKKWSQPRDVASTNLLSMEGVGVGMGMEVERASPENHPQQYQQPSELEARVRHFCDPHLLMCFLCTCTFESREELDDHQQRSTIHLARVEAYLEMVAREEALVDESRLMPRDRAAERRAIFGTDYSPAAAESSSTRTTTTSSRGVDDHGGENVGAKLLKKLGWSEGKGLGKDEQGIVDPITAVKSSRSGAGLGAAPLEPAAHDSPTSYQ